MLAVANIVRTEKIRVLEDGAGIKAMSLATHNARRTGSLTRVGVDAMNGGTVLMIEGLIRRGRGSLDRMKGGKEGSVVRKLNITISRLGIMLEDIDGARGRTGISLLGEDEARRLVTLGSGSRVGIVGARAHRRAVGRHEKSGQGLQELGTNIAMGKGRVTTFSTSHTVDKIGMTEVRDKNVNLGRVVKRSVGVLNKGAKLKEIAEELGVVKEIQRTLARVMDNHSRRLIMKDWMGAVKNKLESSITITVGGRDQAKEGTFLREHFFLGEETKERLRHAEEFELHEVGEVGRNSRVSREATVATMIRAEAPQRVGVETVVHTEQNKLGIPRANPGRGVVVTDQGGLEKIFVVQGGSVDEETTIGENDFIDTFEMIEKTRSERLGDNRTKEESILQLSFVTGTDVGGKLTVVEDKRDRRSRGDGSGRNRGGRDDRRDSGSDTSNNGRREGRRESVHRVGQIGGGKGRGCGRFRSDRGNTDGGWSVSRVQGTRIDPGEDVNARARRGGKVDLMNTEREGNRRRVVGTGGLKGKQKIGVAETTRVTAITFNVNRDRGKDIVDVVGQDVGVGKGHNELGNNFIKQNAAKIDGRLDGAAGNRISEEVLDTNEVGGVHIVQDTGSFRMVRAGGEDDTEVVNVGKRRQDRGDHGGNEKIR